MKILLDTHMILWFFAEDPRLTKKAQMMISDRNNTIFYSVVSTWEVLLKRRQSPDHFSLEGACEKKSVKKSSMKLQ